MHIILCSGSPSIKHIVCDSLGVAGRRWTMCESGMELLAAVRTLAADIAVLDLETPGMGGPLLVSAIQELAPGLPIVAVSTSASADARAVIQLGIPHVILGENGGELHEVASALTARRRIALGVGSR